MSKPIVLLVSGEYPPFTSWGGNAYQLHHLARMLNREGYEVEVIAQSDTGEEFSHLDDLGNIVHRVNPTSSYLYKVARKLARGRARSAVESLGTLAFAARVLEKTWELTRLWGRRILWIETTNWRAETVFLHLFPEFNARTVVRIVTPFEEVVRQNGIDRKVLGVKVHLGMETLQQLLLKHRFYSNDDYMAFFASRVRTSWGKQARGDEHVFLLPFDFGRVKRKMEFSTTHNPDQTVYRFLMVGRIEARKGFDTLCSALAGLSEMQRRRVKILAVGRDVNLGPFGSYKKMLRERFPEIYDTCFEWLGAVSDERLKELFAEADGGIVASTSESFGYNLLELVAADLPVIASDVGATSEFERRGIKYLGKFKTAAELTEVLAGLPRRFREYHAASPQNADRLQELYSKNDSDYLQHVRQYVSSNVTNLERRRRTDARAPVRSADLICCTYNRFEELTISLPSILREADRAAAAGIDTRVYVVYQNEGLPEQVAAWRPDFKSHPRLSFVWSAPAGLTRARNAGIRASSGDLVIFIDDDVVLAPDFVIQHVAAANAHPKAAGVAGRLSSRPDMEGQSALREIGQIRLSGLVVPNFDTVNRSATLVAQTPMGANMSYRRAAVTELLGVTWFDERMPPPAFRDETLLCTELWRAGEHLVYTPDAVLYHFESASGGCGFRAQRTIKQLVKHYSMDYLFLNKLYEPVPPLRQLAPWLLVRRDLKWATNRADTARRLLVNLGGFVMGRVLYASPRPTHEPPKAAPPPEDRQAAATSA